MRTALLLLILLVAISLHAHPGAAIAVSSNGTVYFVDTGGGLFSLDPSGRLARHEGPAFHWFAFDAASRYRNTTWPHVPNGEFRSAGANPTIILSSDFPVTIGSDGEFYYPDGSSGGRIRLTAIEPSGAKTVRATLPEIRRGGETITWLNGLASGPDGSLYYSEDRTIRKVDSRGRLTTLIANVVVPNCTVVPGTEAPTGPYLRGLAVAHDDSIYVAAAGCGVVLRVDTKGRLASVLKAQPPWSPTAVAVHGRDLYVLEYLHTASDDRREWLPRVRKVSPDGKVVTLEVKTRK